MVRLYGFIAAMLFSVLSFAQDTTWVNTLNFDDITKRRGTYIFPDGKEYRKINMHYTLKCDPRTARDNFDCGEWDYLSYIMVIDSTGTTDSSEHEHANFMIGDQTPETYAYSSSMVSDTFYKYNYFRVSDVVTSADSITVGTGNTLSDEGFNSSRIQYLFTAAELTGAGLKPGDITSISLFVSNSGTSLSNTRIRIMQTVQNQLNRFENGPFTTVFEGDMSTITGKNRIECLESFNWDGTSNVLVEFSKMASSVGGVIELESDAIPTAGIKDVPGDQYYEVVNNGFIEIRDASSVFSDLDSAVSVSVWTKGSEALPRNTSIFEAKNDRGNRLVHVHLPWSNKGVYWDCGNANGYDRINKNAADNEYKDNWNHWVFTKNSRTGVMRIYLNGVLWHSGTDKFRDISDITQFRIGKGIRNYQYGGKIDRFSVWKSELTSSEVSDLFSTDITSGQANFSDLICSFSFDNYSSGARSIASDFDPLITADFKGEVRIKDYAEETFFNTTATGTRPKLEFTSANQTSHIDSTLVKQVVDRPLVVIEKFDDTDNPTQTTGFLSGYRAGNMYSYNVDGSKKDSSAVTGATTLNRVMTTYYNYFERIDNIEIGRYITPYGIGLDLGPNGFKWIYDVTDYAQYLEGNVTLNAGNQQELIDLRFEMIEGTPPRDLKDISYYIRRQSRSYNSIANDERFQNTEFDVHPEAETFKLVTRITGHGHNTSSDNLPHCCEWADKTHYLKVDGKDALEWDIWQDDKCALNPVFDQGGNWAPPRAGWCPGAPVDDYNFNLTPFVSGNKVSLDYEIEPVPASNPGQGNGNYVVAMHLMQYGDYNFDNDATVEQIISPNNWEFYSRLNPTCAEPKIRVRNTGKNTITELGLRYGVVGGNPITYYWKDTLVSDESAEIDLPFAIWDYLTDEEQMKFYAEVFSINKGKDEYADNDRSEAEFNVPNVAPKRFTLYFRNNDIEDATLQIFNDGGQVVYEQLDAAAGQLIKEDITLDPGCYKLVCETENQFGLFYPLIPQVGSGLLRLIATGSGFNEAFNPDFGKSIEYYFTVGHALDNKEVVEHTWSLYPNPSNGLITLQSDGNAIGDSYDLRVLSLSGQEVHQESGTISAGIMQVDLTDQPAGIYFVELTENNQKSSFKVAIH
ncbi:MAG: T9SS type A sorting domain-containing protein [Bacteroidia bacterium]|nr:T9SS type A sorting domain-containing protein [Bacteroidia bacterium]